MFERFTAEARSTVVRAQQHAVRRKDFSITPVHLLLALTDGSLSGLLVSYGIDTETVDHLAPGNEARALDDDTALRSIGVDMHAIRTSVEAAFGPGALEGRSSPRRRWPPWTRRAHPARHHACGTHGDPHLAFTANAKKALELSLRESLRLDTHEIGAEGLLLGLLRAGDRELTDILEHTTVSLTDLRSEIEARVRHAA